MYELSSSIIIQGANTQYKIAIWDNKKIITTITFFGKYSEAYDMAKRLEQTFKEICDYLNKKEDKKPSMLKRIRSR